MYSLSCLWCPRFTQYSQLRTLAKLQQPQAASGASAIVSSIAVSPNEELFVTAGVSRRIHLFDYTALVQRQVCLPTAIVYDEQKTGKQHNRSVLSGPPCMSAKVKGVASLSEHESMLCLDGVQACVYRSTGMAGLLQQCLRASPRCHGPSERWGRLGQEDAHVPRLELVTRSKMSCLSWNKLVKEQV
jgi:hypothetical protein